MKNSRRIVVLFASLGLAGIAIAAGETLVPAEQLKRTVDVREVDAHPDQVSGVLVNLSSKLVRSIRVRIDQPWLWTAERHPGENKDDPGRSDFYLVPGEIAPGGHLAFTYRPDVPLPQRSDGRFETSVSVVNLEQID
jgi:hypothetical protein